MVDVLKFILFVFIFVNLAIPGGDIIGVNIKFIFLILLLFCLLFLRYKKKLLALNEVIFISGGLLVWILVSSLIAYNYGVNPYYILMELRVVIPVFLITFLFWVLYAWNQQLSSFFTIIVIVSFVFYSLYKIFLEFMLVFGVLDINSLFLVSEYIGGEVPVVSTMPFDMVRIFWTKPDFILALSPIFIFVFAKSVGGDKWIWPSIGLISIAVLIGYSRMLIVIYVIMLIIGMMSKYGVFRVFFVFFPIIVIASIPLVQYLVEFYEMRISEEYTGMGDETRWIQMESLLDGWMNKFFLGSGMGSNASFIRSYELPFVYEMWLLSFFMKTGLVGFILFIILILTANIKLLKRWFSRFKGRGGREVSFVLFFVINITILSSFTNQYLPSTVTGTFWGVLIYMYRSWAEENITYNKIRSLY